MEKVFSSSVSVDTISLGGNGLVLFYFKGDIVFSTKYTTIPDLYLLTSLSEPTIQFLRADGSTFNMSIPSVRQIRHPLGVIEYEDIASVYLDNEVVRARCIQIYSDLMEFVFRACCPCDSSEGGGGTVTSVNAAFEVGVDAMEVDGVPITNAGTMVFRFLGNDTQYVRGDGTLAPFPSVGVGTVTSVNVVRAGGVNAVQFTGGPITDAGSITMSFLGGAGQYVRGDGTLATFPSIGVYSVNNGLNENPSGNFRLGGVLVENTVIDVTSAHFLRVTGDRSGLTNHTLLVENTSTTASVASRFTASGAGSVAGVFSAIGSNGVGVDASGNFYGVRASVSGSSVSNAALFGDGSLATGVIGSTSSGLAAGRFIRNLSTASAVQEVLYVETNATTPAVGAGASIVFVCDTVGQPTQITEQGTLEMAWANVTHGARQSTFAIKTYANAVKRVAIGSRADGRLFSDGYGDGVFTGTVAYYLAVDSLGNIIETAGGGGGGSGTVTSVNVTPAVGVTAITTSGGPVTTSGTIQIAFAGTSSQYVRGDGTLATLPSSSVAWGGITGTITDQTDLINYLTAGYVPYTGANADVDLGIHILNAHALHAKGTGGSGKLGLRHQSSDATSTGQETALFADSNGNPKWKNAGLPYVTFDIDGVTADRVYTFPNNSGTVALISDLTGGTVTSVNASVTPSTALAVTGGPITGAGTLAFSWTGSAAQVIRGDGTLATLPSGGVYYAVAAPNVTITLNSTQYNFVEVGATSTATESARNQLLPAGTVSDWYIVHSTAHNGNGNIIYTLRKNTVSTPITITVAPGSAAGVFSNTVNSTTANGTSDLFSIQIQNLSTSGAQPTWIYSRLRIS
jgi:hypothetical protein